MLNLSTNLAAIIPINPSGIFVFFNIIISLFLNSSLSKSISLMILFSIFFLFSFKKISLFEIFLISSLFLDIRTFVAKFELFNLPPELSIGPIR